MNRRRILVAVLLILVVIAGALYLRDGRQGHRIGSFDFLEPPCAPAGRPDASQADVRVAYLGVGGMVIEWRGETIATAPQFTRIGMVEAGIGHLRSDATAIEQGLNGFDAASWQLILSGHAHYDHLADVPLIMQRHSPQATLWTNGSGEKMLHAFPELQSRVFNAETAMGQWIDVLDGKARIAPLKSLHASHYGRYHYAPGEVTEPWDDWESHRVSEMREGQTLNFLIDLLDDQGEIAFRIYYQDAVNPNRSGFPPAEWIAERGVDLAVLCAPASWREPGHPNELLAHLKARHGMAIHYEDFFADEAQPKHFVTSLTDARMASLLERIERGVAQPVAASAPGCGPSSAAWTVPLQGEWVGFRSNAVLRSSDR